MCRFRSHSFGKALAGLLEGREGQGAGVPVGRAETDRLFEILHRGRRVPLLQTGHSAIEVRFVGGGVPPERFVKVGRRFLGENVESAVRIER